MVRVTPEELARTGASGPAAAELRAYIARGLRKALASHRLREEDIEDFTQDAIVRIIEKLHTFRGDSRFTTWAMAVAIRGALGALRTRRYRERLRDDGVEVSEMATARPKAWEDPTRPIERQRLHAELYRAVRERLTDRQRCAVLSELEGAPSGEIAERLGINRNALYKLHHDARVKLRAAILDAGFSEEEVRNELHLESEES